MGFSKEDAIRELNDRLERLNYDNEFLQDTTFDMKDVDEILEPLYNESPESAEIATRIRKEFLSIKSRKDISRVMKRKH